MYILLLLLLFFFNYCSKVQSPKSIRHHLLFHHHHHHLWDRKGKGCKMVEGSQRALLLCLALWARAGYTGMGRFVWNWVKWNDGSLSQVTSSVSGTKGVTCRSWVISTTSFSLWRRREKEEKRDCRPGLTACASISEPIWRQPPCLDTAVFCQRLTWSWRGWCQVVVLCWFAGSINSGPDLRGIFG